jgi:hypothetical protein
VRKGQSIIAVVTADGRTLIHRTCEVRGTPGNPMTAKEVSDKAVDLMAPVLGKARARRLCDAIWGIEKIKDIRKLRPLLRA